MRLTGHLANHLHLACYNFRVSHILMKIPPRTITLNDAVLLCYAVLDERVGYTVGHGLFFVVGKEIGRVPRLAICKDRDSAFFTLYYCDEGSEPAWGGYQLPDRRRRKEQGGAHLSRLIDTLGRQRLINAEPDASDFPGFSRVVR
jgi:hypothetical protein